MSKLTATWKTNGKSSFIFTVDGPQDEVDAYEEYQASIKKKDGTPALVIDEVSGKPLFFRPNFEVWENEAGETTNVNIEPKEFANQTFNLIWLEPTDEYDGKYVLENSIESQSIKAKAQQAAALSAGFKRRTSTSTVGASKAEANLDTPAPAPARTRSTVATSARPRGRR